MTDALQEPWASEARRAQATLARFDHVVAQGADGATRARLTQVRAAVAAAVQRCEAVAAEGQRLSRSLAELGPDRVTAELKAARRASTDSVTDPLLAEAATARLAAAEAQYRVVHRFWDGIETAQARLAADLARLDELVARAVELAVLPAAGTAPTTTSDGSLRDAVDELEALRRAFDELDASSDAPQGPIGPGLAATPVDQPDRPGGP